MTKDGLARCPRPRLGTWAPSRRSRSTHKQDCPPDFRGQRLSRYPSDTQCQESWLVGDFKVSVPRTRKQGCFDQNMFTLCVTPESSAELICEKFHEGIFQDRDCLRGVVAMIGIPDESGGRSRTECLKGFVSRFVMALTLCLLLSQRHFE
ncbi:hypothetical protein CEXT_220081 [Caerostris extrusa]|uniref:Uncharacterized protein n=1 Tax=Caerostris extrusa TaxID=172846 RepID=A0AAV4NEV3_CAEEX|nr:hypothetical protein CEXT_220081 [Caerostris extrusa]